MRTLNVEIDADSDLGLVEGLAVIAAMINEQIDGGEFIYEDWRGGFKISETEEEDSEPECIDGQGHRRELYGTASDGTNFYRCSRCGFMTE